MVSNRGTWAYLTFFAVNLIVCVVRLAQCADPEGEGGGGGGGEESEILVSKSILINKNGDKTEILDQVLQGRDINLIKLEVCENIRHNMSSFCQNAGY